MARSKLTPAAALASFCQDLARRNYSPETIKGYRFCAEKFFAYLQGTDLVDLAGVTLQTLLDYMKHLVGYVKADGNPYSKAAKDSSIKAVRRLFRFLKAKGLLLVDPTDGLPPIHKEQAIPRNILTRQEMDRLLAQPDTATPLGLRDRAIMETLYSTAVRRKELCALSIYDVDPAAGLVRVNLGKGKRDRVVPIGRMAVAAVKEYLDNGRPKLVRGKGTQALFLDYRGNALHPNRVGGIIAAHVREARLDKEVSCHSFRHTCATEMLRGGASIRYVQEMLGHKHLKTTQIYTRVVPVDLQKAHKKAHPRERMKGKGVEATPFDGVPRFFYKKPRRKRRTP